MNRFESWVNWMQENGYPVSWYDSGRVEKKCAFISPQKKLTVTEERIDCLYHYTEQASTWDEYQSNSRQEAQDILNLFIDHMSLRRLEALKSVIEEEIVDWNKEKERYK